MLHKFTNRIRNEAAATDPILIIAGIAVSLILLVGGSFAVQGIITNGKDLNAKGDLDKVSVAEVAYYAQNDRYVAYEKNGSTVLEDSGVGFRPTESAGADLIVEVHPDGQGWNAVARSASGARFVKTSESNTIITVGKESAADLAKTGLTAAELAALAALVG